MERMTRKTGIMDFGLFERLIRECGRYPEVREVHLHGFGEPLLDRDLPRKVALAKKVGIPYTYIVTTGAMLTADLSQALIRAGLDGIKFSFYGMKPETYERVHKNLRFARTLANIESFFRVRDELGAPNPAVRFQFNLGVASQDEMDEFLEHWRPFMDADRGDVFMVSGLHNWAGGRDYATTRLSEEERHCVWPFMHIQIPWDGRVVPCVFDYHGSLLLGDVTRSSIRRIWSSQAYEEVRAVWRNRKSYSIDICARCDGPEATWAPRRLDAQHQPAPAGKVQPNGRRLEAARRLLRELRVAAAN
jgi:MoaA/NifB/PqqE/SkfB family radical SAM enzyme